GKTGHRLVPPPCRPSLRRLAWALGSEPCMSALHNSASVLGTGLAERATSLCSRNLRSLCPPTATIRNRWTISSVMASAREPTLVVPQFKDASSRNGSSTERPPWRPPNSSSALCKASAQLWCEPRTSPSVQRQQPVALPTALKSSNRCSLKVQVSSDRW